MQIIGVCGRKGGSGKTTTAVHLAAELTSRGLSVCLVDCDTQGSASYWAEPGKLPMQVQRKQLESTDQVDAWANEIESLPAEYVILDSPPHLDAALAGIIVLADQAVIPCGPSGMDLVATAETVKFVRSIREKRGGAKPGITLVPNRVDQRTASGRELETELKNLGEDVAPAIHSRTAFSDAFNLGEWVGEYSPKSPAHQEIQELANHILAQLKKTNHQKKGRS